MKERREKREKVFLFIFYFFDFADKKTRFYVRFPRRHRSPRQRREVIFLV